MVTQMKKMRICIVGDELVAGSGDPRALGWVGRVLARTELPPDTHVFSLARVGESTTQLVGRWEAEALPRFEHGADNRLIVAVGSADVEAAVSTPRTRLNLATILDTACDHNIQPLVVGPPPLRCCDHRQLRQIAKACGEVCQRRNLPYVNMFTPLLDHDQWHDDLALSADSLPSQAGYGLMAWLVLHCGWYEWLGLEPRQLPTAKAGG